MNKTINKKRFDNIMKGTHVFLSWSVRALYVLMGFVLIGFLVALFIPKDLMNFDLDNIEHINIQLSNVLYQIDESLFTGIINVKWTLVLLGFMALANLAFLQFVMIYIRNILRDTIDQNPFSDNNVNRLKYIGYGYLIASVVLPYINNLFFWQLIHQLDLFEATINFSIHFQSVFMGVIILILANIFDYGSYLQEDHDMTV
ncbi:DUF2975 domain-containing protein [Candidatus Xianfuyuplasma coldseepsis]|uniref:DUF2975 domain-containing protein n=1 Tax=Candidatus Xianfuyuplasma coldseepsis TaxID=2782163 RepID=A0A7L7KSU8_9MOLU|nr:DUF2975 domain-containing protein [Xianfuyuplasma coldseepsis]QMS85014.1 DUF2975 domain-containing protein [Xianfuyuplasma coldseepsis]